MRNGKEISIRRSVNGEDVPFYAERFSTNRNQLHFSPDPAPKTIEELENVTPDNFRFALKAPRDHALSKLKDCADTLGIFL